MGVDDQAAACHHNTMKLTAVCEPAKGADIRVLWKKSPLQFRRGETINEAKAKLREAFKASARPPTGTGWGRVFTECCAL